MFSLIVVIVSIVLIALLAAIAVYYGGPAFANAQNKAKVDQLLNEGSQIKAASVLYATDNGGTAPSTLGQLTDTSAANPYLRSAPTGWSVTTGNAVVAYTQVQGKDVCNEFNSRYGIAPQADGSPPSCATVDPAKPACCP